MIEWGDNKILGKEVNVSSTNIQTRKLLQHLKSITVALPEKASPISLEEYIKEVSSLR